MTENYLVIGASRGITNRVGEDNTGGLDIKIN